MYTYMCECVCVRGLNEIREFCKIIVCARSFKHDASVMPSNRNEYVHIRDTKSFFIWKLWKFCLQHISQAHLLKQHLCLPNSYCMEQRFSRFIRCCWDTINGNVLYTKIILFSRQTHIAQCEHEMPVYAYLILKSVISLRLISRYNEICDFQPFYWIEKLHTFNRTYLQCKSMCVQHFRLTFNILVFMFTCVCDSVWVCA